MHSTILRRSGVLFSIASIMMFTCILLYLLVYQPPSGSWQERIHHMDDRWALISAIWSTEFFAIVLTAWIAFNFAHINNWWNLVAIGHLFMMVEYALLLGGYPSVESQESFQILNHLATWIFASSNLIWLAGMAGVYLSEKGWIKYLGAGLALLSGLMFLTVVIGLTTLEQVLVGGFIVNVLYLINAYYGIKILSAQQFLNWHTGT